jgi:hypothetical protein
MKKRLIEFLAYLGIGQNKFETTIGTSTGFVSKVGDSIRKANLAKISAAYPELNISWLLTGEGGMLKSGSVVTHGKNSPAVAGSVSGGMASGDNVSGDKHETHNYAANSNNAVTLKHTEAEVRNVFEENRNLVAEMMRQNADFREYNEDIRAQFATITRLHDEITDLHRENAELRERLARLEGA